MKKSELDEALGLATTWGGVSHDNRDDHYCGDMCKLARALLEQTRRLEVAREALNKVVEMGDGYCCDSGVPMCCSNWADVARQALKEMGDE